MIKRSVYYDYPNNLFGNYQLTFRRSNSLIIWQRLDITLIIAKPNRTPKPFFFSNYFYIKRIRFLNLVTIISLALFIFTKNYKQLFSHCSVYWYYVLHISFNLVFKSGLNQMENLQLTVFYFINDFYTSTDMYNWCI